MPLLRVANRSSLLAVVSIDCDNPTVICSYRRLPPLLSFFEELCGSRKPDVVVLDIEVREADVNLHFVLKSEQEAQDVLDDLYVQIGLCGSNLENAATTTAATQAQAAIACECGPDGCCPDEDAASEVSGSSEEE